MRMMVKVGQVFQVAGTDGVKCYRFACGHERILSVSDSRKFDATCRDSLSGAAFCVECERQAEGVKAT